MYMYIHSSYFTTTSPRIQKLSSIAHQAEMQNVQICASRLGKKRTISAGLPIPKTIFFQFRVASNNLGKCGGREEEDLK